MTAEYAKCTERVRCVCTWFQMRNWGNTSLSIRIQRAGEISKTLFSWREFIVFTRERKQAQQISRSVTIYWSIFALSWKWDASSSRRVVLRNGNKLLECRAVVRFGKRARLFNATRYVLRRIAHWPCEKWAKRHRKP